MNPRTALVMGIVSAFMIGISLGLMGGIVFAHRTSRAGLRGPFASTRGPLPGPERMLPILERALELRPEQLERIRGLAASSRGDLRAVQDSLRARIRRELDPGQLERFDRIERRWMGPGRGRRPGTRGGPPPDLSPDAEEGEPR